MLKNASTPLKAAVLGLGLLTAVQLQAQTSTSGSTSGQTTSGQTATGTGSGTSGTTAGAQSSGSTAQQSQLRDARTMIGATLSTTGGRYGTVADVVFGGSGNVQYVLVQREGQFHPVPFSLLQFGATGDLTVSASSATLDAVTVDRNNLQSLSNPGFATRMRAAFGPDVARSFVNPANVTTGTGNNNANPDSTAGQREVFSLAGLLGGTINAQGGEAGTIATVAITENGQIAFAVGTNANGDQRFAFPLLASSLNNAGNGVSLNTALNALTGVSVPNGSLPSLADETFVNSFRSTFGDNAFGIAGRISGLSQTESDNARRNDRFNSDPVAAAGDASRGGADAVASAGDSRRGGADAVARAGDRATDGGTSANGAMQGTTTSSTGTAASGTTSGGGIVNAAPEAPSTQPSDSQNGLIQLRDLLNFRVQAQDGAFGRVADIVLDRNGNVQYLLGSYRGQTFALPFMASALGSTPNTLQFNVPISALQQLAIDPQRLPSLSNQAFTQRMQQIFGSSFGANSNQTTAGYTPNTTGAGSGSTTGASSTGTIGTSTGATGTGTASSGTGTTGGTTTGTTTAGTSTGANQDTWTWPSSSSQGSSSASNRYPAPDPRMGGRQDIRPNPITKGPRANTGTGTGGTDTGTTGTGRYPAPDPRMGGRQDIRPNPITKSANRNTNNSGVGTGGGADAPPPRGRATGRNGTGTTGSGASGSGTTTGGGSTTGTGTGTTGGGTTGGTTGGTGGSSGASGS